VAPNGTRPRQPKDQRYENAYLFAAISHALTMSSHSCVLLDRSDWRTTGAFTLPKT
tara:strand:- start:1073 stop:1240 length:168 start_codon:yes stop_codon:yes gene_type:complete